MSDFVRVVKFLEKKLNQDFSDIRLDLGENKSRLYYGCAVENQVFLNGWFIEDRKRAIKTFIHELIHVWQHKTNRLRLENGVEYWFNKECSEWQNELVSPWEIEAVVKTNDFYSEMEGET